MVEILCVTGSSATGKSSVSKHLSKEFGVPLFSLGDYQREKFTHYGTPQQYHRKLGLDVTSYGLWPEFVNQIASLKSDKGIIVDGIYTYKFLELLKKNFKGENVHLMQITATRHARLRFFQIRTNLEVADAFKEMSKIDKIKRDVGLIEVLRRADVTVRNNTGLNEFLRNASNCVKEFFQVV